ncbi:CUB and sushi domain-containing protein 3 isoform X2, partial [Clarias magur]
LTGFQIPPPVTSTGSVFSLRLTSDFAVSAHGFKIYYEELQSSSCGNPGVPPKGILYGTRFNVGDKIRYSCVSGYVLDGHPQLTCVTNAGNAAVWDFPVPICRGSFKQAVMSEYEINTTAPPRRYFCRRGRFWKVPTLKRGNCFFS